jgi:hypothetical protein
VRIVYDSHRAERTATRVACPLTDMLEMRTACERGQAPLVDDGLAAICSFECTFCFRCADDMNRTCPNCGGALVSRPRRTVAGQANA